MSIAVDRKNYSYDAFLKLVDDQAAKKQEDRRLKALESEYQLDPPQEVELKQVPGTDCIWADSNGDIWNNYANVWRKLTESVRPEGYRQVTYKKNGKHVSTGAHRLVAAAFHGPCPEGMECMHLNDNPSDNRPDNLKWGTHEENMSTKRTPENYNSHLTKEQVEDIRRLRSEKWSITRIANFYGIRYHQVSLLLRNKTYQDTDAKRYKRLRRQAMEQAIAFLVSRNLEDPLEIKANRSTVNELERIIKRRYKDDKYA